jgi:hypothetical protein
MRRTWALCAAFVSFVSTLGAVAPGLAQPHTGERWVRGRPHRMWGDASFFAENDQWGFSPSFGARIRAVDGHVLAQEAFILDVDIAWRSIGASGAFDSFRVGNPYGGLRFGVRSRDWVARGGVGSTVPVTNAFRDGTEDHLAYALGQALWGGWSGWLLEPNIQPLILRGDFELHGEYFQVGFDAFFAVIFPFERPLRNNTEYAFQTGGFGAWTPIPEIALGARLQIFFASDWIVGFAGRDEAQVALLPFFRIQLEPAFIEFRLTMNLDDPYGFAFNGTNGVWAASVAAGGRF